MCGSRLNRTEPEAPPLQNQPPLNTTPKSTQQDLAFKLLPYRVDAGARAHHERAAGEEIDWAALAKGRHTYKQRLQRGEVTALSSSSPSAAVKDNGAGAGAAA